MGAFTVIVVLLVNIGLAVGWRVSHGTPGGFGLIYQGNCTRSKRISLWIHLAINALGTLLLSASNYAMQCLSAPTRKEVSKAHAKGVWLDIGIPSIRNLGKIS